MYKKTHPDERFNELDQYVRLKDAGFPVATYYDLEPFVKGFRNAEDRESFVKEQVTHDYHLRAYLPHMLPAGIAIGSALFCQIKKMFQQASEQQIPADLYKRNIGLDQDGRAIYFDLSPEDNEGWSEKEKPFTMIEKSCRRSFDPTEGDLFRALKPQEH